MSNELKNGYDIIGDVHGHAAKLEGLLSQLGYKIQDDVWFHESRSVVFLGDLVDYGPQQLETVAIVRRMQKAGTAQVIMGNHEFNAIAWFNGWREKNQKNYEQHEPFLKAIVGQPRLHAEIIEWFQTLPIWLEVPEHGVRFVHACWNSGIVEGLHGPLWTTEQLKAGATKPETGQKRNAFHHASEVLLKAPEDETVLVEDHHGVPRGTRIEWWRNYEGSELVFFGHYRMTQKSSFITSPRALCLDYSDKSGKSPLVAYRFDFGDTNFSDEKIVTFPLL